MRGISWPAEDLLVSQEGPCFMELVSYGALEDRNWQDRPELNYARMETNISDTLLTKYL